MPTRAIVAALAVLSLSLGCGSGSSRSDSGPRRDASALEWSETPYLSATATHSFTAAETVTTPGIDYAARIETDTGTMVVDLAEVDAPIAVNSFVFLARHHFFDGLAFHRVIDGFMAQGGDPNTLAMPSEAWGTGGPGYQFVNETAPSLLFDVGGVLAMANAGRDTNGSQFFITFAAAPHLDGGYTIFGRAIEGAEVLASIARGEPPATPTRITTVQILER